MDDDTIFISQQLRVSVRVSAESFQLIVNLVKKQNG